MAEGIWYCVSRSCGEQLGELVGKELRVTSGAKCITDGPNLIVECPKCGQTKVWYTSDTLVRATYQLVDAMVSLFIARALPKASRAIQSLEEVEDNGKK
jgi:hypothetical protein